MLAAAASAAADVDVLINNAGVSLRQNLVLADDTTVQLKAALSADAGVLFQNPVRARSPVGPRTGPLTCADPRRGHR
ncbi:hypothetical protein ACFXKD_21620 [Nocardiopsis aegyptia]|uniref:hypothetical protein n=1 Tax=Nocardiopsis aegyptia TaxID=220378 RepID=UPI00366B2564